MTKHTVFATYEDKVLLLYTVYSSHPTTVREVRAELNHGLSIVFQKQEPLKIYVGTDGEVYPKLGVVSA